MAITLIVSALFVFVDAVLVPVFEWSIFCKNGLLLLGTPSLLLIFAFSNVFCALSDFIEIDSTD